MTTKGLHDTRRRFEQWAHNPGCEANTISAVHGISMVEVARLDGAEPKRGQSPFAIARGHSFERKLFESDGEWIRKELEKAGVLPPKSKGFADCRLTRNGGPVKNLEQARKKTDILLGKLAKGGKNLPTIIAGATVSIPGNLMLPEALLVLDRLVAVPRDGSVDLVVGEIKTYPDRGGYTAPAELALARAQAGVYVRGLRLVIAALGFSKALRVRDKGILVLTKPGSNRPVVKAEEDLRYQILRARRGFDSLRRAATALPGKLNENEAVEAVRAAPTDYCEGCLGFCERESICHARAFEQQAPSILGEDVARLLGSITLDRGVELMNGSPPGSVAEADLQRQFLAFEEVQA